MGKLTLCDAYVVDTSTRRTTCALDVAHIDLGTDHRDAFDVTRAVTDAERERRAQARQDTPQPAPPMPKKDPPVVQSTFLAPDSVAHVPRVDLAPIQLDTPRDYQLLRLAIEDRADALEKLATKTQGEKYPKEARIISGDASRLRDDILPMISEQTEIALATPDEAQAAIKNGIRDVVRRHSKESDGNTDHEAVLLQYLGERINRYATQIAIAAFNAGVAYRETEPSYLLVRYARGLEHVPAVKGGD